MSLPVPIMFHIIIGISINVCKLHLSCVNLVSNEHGVFHDVITIANPGYVVGLQSMVYVIDVLYELRELTNKLVVKVVLLEEKNEQLKDEKKQLKNKMSKIEKRLSTLEGDHDKLLADQLVSTMDRALLDKVLRDNRCLGTDEHMIFSTKSMEKAIKCE